MQRHIPDVPKTLSIDHEVRSKGFLNAVADARTARNQRTRANAVYRSFLEILLETGRRYTPIFNTSARRRNPASICPDLKRGHTAGTSEPGGHGRIIR